MAKRLLGKALHATDSTSKPKVTLNISSKFIKYTESCYLAELNLFDIDPPEDSKTRLQIDLELDQIEDYEE